MQLFLLTAAPTQPAPCQSVWSAAQLSSQFHYERETGSACSVQNNCLRTVLLVTSATTATAPLPFWPSFIIQMCSKEKVLGLQLGLVGMGICVTRSTAAQKIHTLIIHKLHMYRYICLYVHTWLHHMWTHLWSRAKILACGFYQMITSLFINIINFVVSSCHGEYNTMNHVNPILWLSVELTTGFQGQL